MSGRVNGRDDDDPPEAPPWLEDAFGPSSASGEPAAASMRILDDVILMRQRTPQMLIAGHIVSDTLVVLYGPPDSYKTFSMVNLGLSVATGIDWLGAAVHQSGPVVSCVAEGMGRYRYRIAAAKLDAGFALDQCIGLHTVPDAFSLVEPREVAAFIDAVRPIDPVLVTIDPLIRYMAGADEKDSRDMSRVVDACALIQRELETTVLLVHHTGWDESRERGSSVLRAAADTVLAQREDDGTIVLSCEKQKDLDRFAPIRLQRQIFPVLGAESCLLKLALAETEADADHLTLKQREALTVLQQCFPEGATHSQWMRALPPGFEERTLYRAKQVLAAAGLIHGQGKSIKRWVAGPDSLTSKTEHLTGL